MKEIQGKIKFGASPFTKFDIYLWNTLTDNAPVGGIKLSEITEEQAAEFVDEMDFIGSFRDYKAEKNEGWSYIITTAKESLISLLKANDVWIKEWKEIPIDIYYLPDFGCQKHPQECYLNDKEEYEQLPDDLLLIKLT